MLNPRTASNYDLISVAVFLSKWKNLAIQISFLSIIENIIKP